MDSRAASISSTFQSTKTSLTDNRSKRKVIVKYLKTTLFTLAICTTLALSSLPIIFFYVTSYTDYFAVQQSNNDTTQLQNHPANLTLTSSCETDGSSGIVDVEKPIVCELYSGTLCLPYLREWQECLLPKPLGADMRIVPIDNTRTQLEIEDDINNLQVLLTSVGQTFTECMERAIPFICHYYFPIVEDCPSSTSIQSTQEECMDIENNVCRQAIALSTSINLPIELPDCDTLPHGMNDSDSTDNNSSAMITTNNGSPSNISCRDDFILINSTCFPRCDRFETNRHSLVTARIISEVFSAALAVLVSSICIILSVYNRKIMFKFPSIFMFFLFVDVWITGVPLLIIAFDRTSLMCSSVNLIEAVMNPTILCIITGTIWQYMTVSFTLWWFFHLCIFFYMIMFPFHARRMIELKRTNYLAVIFIIIGVLLPLPAVVVSTVLDQYRLSDFPPSVCISNSTVWFYSGNIVICLSLGIGTSILIIVFWKIHKKKVTHAKQNREEQKLTTAEKKLIFASFCYIIFGATAMVYYSVANGDQDKVLEALTKYFICESTGHVPGKCDRGEFERFIHTELQTFSNLSLGFLTFGILNFVVSWQKLRKSIKDQIQRIIKGTASLVSNTSSSFKFEIN